MITTNPVLNQLQTYPAEALYAKKRALRASGRHVYDFSVGDPIEPTDPRLIDAFKAGVPEISQYPTIAGEADFLAACAEWLQRRFGVKLDPKTQILPSSGSKEAIFHLPLTFIDPSTRRRGLLFGVPAYPVYQRSALFCGAEPLAIELDATRDFRLELDRCSDQQLEDAAIVWINYPHNPTGACVDRDYLQRTAEFCRTHDILLCSDECYADLYLDDPAPPSLLQVATDNVLAFHSLSKRSGMTGYRSGFIAGDAQLIATLRRSRANYGVAPSVMVQHMSAVAWRDERHAAARRNIFRVKRDVMLEMFHRAGIECAPCKATFYLWVKTPGDTRVDAYAEGLADLGILVSPAGFHGSQQPYFRIALVPSVEDCRQAADLWHRNLNRIEQEAKR